MNNPKIKNLVLAALFIGLGLVLPIFTGQIKEIGNMLLPMHIPVLLCGFICGWKYGLAVGLILPLMRSFLFGMPPIYPEASAMALELGAYGFVAGYAYSHARWHCVKSLLRCLIMAMVTGRIVWGITRVIFLGINGTKFSFLMFISGAFTMAIPGIILQLVLIPSVMVALNRAKLVTFGKKNQDGKIENV